MTIKNIKPQTAEQRTIMRLLMAYSSAEKRDFYDVFQQARKRSNLLALYDHGQLIGCLLLAVHKNYLVAYCLLKDTIFVGEEVKDTIENLLKTRYPSYMVYLELKSYSVS